MVPVSTMIAIVATLLLGLIIPAVLYFMMKKHFGNGDYQCIDCQKCMEKIL